MEYLGISVGCKGTLLYGLLTILFINGKVSAPDLAAELHKQGLNISEVGIQILNYIFMVIVLINVGGHISLILGTVQKRHNLILFWLISSSLGTVVWTIFFFSGGYSRNFIICLIYLICIWILFFPLYKKIKSERQTSFSHLAM